MTWSARFAVTTWPGTFRVSRELEMSPHCGAYPQVIRQRPDTGLQSTEYRGSSTWWINKENERNPGERAASFSCLAALLWGFRSESKWVGVLDPGHGLVVSSCIRLRWG